MVSPFAWFKTAFTHRATGDVSMSKVAVLLFAVDVCFSIAWGSIHPSAITWQYLVLNGLGLVGFLLAVTNRINSRKVKWTVNRETGISMEQDFGEPEKDRQ